MADKKLDESGTAFNLDHVHGSSDDNDNHGLAERRQSANQVKQLPQVTTH